MQNIFGGLPKVKKNILADFTGLLKLNILFKGIFDYFSRSTLSPKSKAIGKFLKNII